MFQLHEAHNLLDIIEVNKFIKKKIYPFESNENNCCFIRANKTTDYLFEDSFTISMNVFINDIQLNDTCIIGKQGYDMGIFIMKNDAIVVQLWDDENNLHQIWYPHKTHTNQWINVSFKVDMDKRKMGLYIDGKLVKTQENLGDYLMDYSGKDLWIGSIAFKNPFKGKISNLCIFDYPLTDSEILKLYTDGYKTEEGLINTNFVYFVY